jgi:hypothetical protein
MAWDRFSYRRKSPANFVGVTLRMTEASELGQKEDFSRKVLQACFAVQPEDR